MSMKLTGLCMSFTPSETADSAIGRLVSWQFLQ